MSDVLLSVKHLTLGTAQHAIVEDISFEVHAGEVLGIVGESGSGKTTLARAVTGLLPRHIGIQQGTITIRGHDVTRGEWRPAITRGRHVGLIFQNPMGMFNPVLPVRTQLTEGWLTHRRGSRRTAIAEAHNMLREVGLGDQVDRIMKSYPHQLSGGMLQRIAMAATLLPGPELVVADEPTASLDAVNQFGVLSLLARLKDRLQFSLIFISHDLTVVSNLANHVLVLHRGKIVESGSARKVFIMPEAEYTRELLQAERTLGLYSDEEGGHGASYS